ncbi:hypothetical protein [Pandoraea terrigena]|nr:hypothetical protein [Pandoraea terrigena]
MRDDKPNDCHGGYRGWLRAARCGYLWALCGVVVMKDDFDAIGAILLFVGLACVFIAACSALGIVLIETSFRA